MLKKIVALIMATAMLLGITACSSNSTPKTSGAPAASAAPAKTSISFAVGNDPGTLDPMGTTANEAWGQIGYQIYDSLVTLDENMKLTPVLAEKWEKTDPLTYKLSLRKGVKFSDGSDFKASDVLFTLNLAKEDKSNAVIVAKVDWAKTKVIDDYTLQLAYTEQSAIALTQLCYLRITGEKPYKASKDKMKTTPVGTSAYMLKENGYVVGTSITLVANPNYWGEKPKIQTVVYKIITDASQRTNALLAGDVDFSFMVAPSDVETVNKNTKYVTEVSSTKSNDSLIFNQTKNSVCKDINVRKAIAYGINKEGIKKVAYSNLGQTAIGPVPRLFQDFDKSWITGGYYDYNLDKAKEAFKASGLPAGTKLTIITKGQAEQVSSAQVIQASLKEVGFAVSIVNYDASVFSKNAMDSAGGWDLAMYSTSSPQFVSLDAFNAYFMNLGLGGYKDISPKFVELINKGLKNSEISDVKPYSKQMVELFMAEVPWFSYMETPVINSYSKSIKGIKYWYSIMVPVRFLSF